jgi:hypothetical protein
VDQHKLKLVEETAAERERLSKEYEAKVEQLRHSAEELEARQSLVPCSFMFDG